MRIFDDLRPDGAENGLREHPLPKISLIVAERVNVMIYVEESACL